MLSPIQLKRHSFTHIELKQSTAQPPSAEETYDTHLALDHHQGQQPGEWRATLRVKLSASEGASVRYAGEFHVQGIFQVHASFDSSKVEDLVRFNAGSLLLAAVREMLLNLTSRSTLGPLELPTLNPQMFLQQPTTGTKAGPASKQRRRKAATQAEE
jgi:preprotein translocase subunit SecB